MILNPMRIALAVGEHLVRGDELVGRCLKVLSSASSPRPRQTADPVVLTANEALALPDRARIAPVAANAPPPIIVSFSAIARRALRVR